MMKRWIGAVLAGLLALVAGRSAHAQISVGPDASNHIMADNIAAGVLAFTDISGTGALVTTGDDAAGTVTFPVGNSLFLYGALRTQLRVSTNGYISTLLTDTGGDWSNDCPAPVLPGTGGGDRLYVLHDDLDVDVYYEFIPANNMSIIQWQGTYLSNGAPVNFQAQIFHALDVVAFVYDTVSQTGSSSTTGAQNAAATIGLNFACNTAGSIPNGKNIVFGTLAMTELRFDQPLADNDEYFELAGVPGFSLNGLTLVVIGDGSGGSGVIESITPLTGNAFSSNGDTRFVGAENTFTLGTASAIFGGAAGLNFENDDTTTVLLVRGFTGSGGQDLDTNDDGFLDVLPWTQVVDAVSNLSTGSELPYATAQVGPDGTASAFHIQRCIDLTGPWVIAAPDPATGNDSPLNLNLCPTCGDNVVTFPEPCDTGVASATCDADCTAPLCGDGVLNLLAGENCDDGNLIPSDDCPTNCQPATCGDGFLHLTAPVPEVCDTAGESMSCDADCTAPSCGDGTLNGTAGEACDDGGESATCNVDCTTAMCGDLTVNNTAGETCDDGMRTTTCDSDCTAVSCGDGHVNMTDGEECDGDGAGNGGETLACDTDCTDSMCGDMVVNTTANEECDDGAETAACDDDCTTASCGDDHVNAAAGEECDDGNTTDGDGCDSSCLDEGGMGGGGAGGGNVGGGGGAGGGNVGGGNVGGGATGGNGTGGNGTGGDTIGGNGSGGGDDGATDDGGGCDCATAGRDSSPFAPWALMLGLGLAARRRRRAA